jgi:hypothetical protein
MCSSFQQVQQPQPKAQVAAQDGSCRWVFQGCWLQAGSSLRGLTLGWSWWAHHLHRHFFLCVQQQASDRASSFLRPQ